MLFANLALPAAILVCLTALTLFIASDWRASLVALALQYLGVFLLVNQNWTLEMATAKLVAGWMTAVVLGMAVSSLPIKPGAWTEIQSPPYEDLSQPAHPSGSALPSGWLFRLLAATLVGLVIFSIAPSISGQITGISLPAAIGILALVGLGLLQLGFTARPFYTVLGLLTVFSGFEIFYAAVETSALVAGLLAAVNLGLALAGAYLLVSPFMEESE